MEKDVLVSAFLGKDTKFVIHKVHTLVIGSGAAGLNAAIQLYANGIQDTVIITEGLQMGTSINTGSDKQTYYKLSMCGAESDSPHAVAEALYAGGSMHGDLALIEASLSARAFMGLVNLGVPFPRDKFGQFVGFKTDHDPLQRGTSVGPHTSREMCRLMIEEIRRREIAVHENRVAVSLLVAEEDDQRLSSCSHRGHRSRAAQGCHGPEFERISVWYVFDQISLECLRNLYAMHPALYQHRRRRYQ